MKKAKRKRAITDLSGWLTKKDIEKLGKASIRVRKHRKEHYKGQYCAKCDMSWGFRSLKCPVCYGSVMETSLTKGEINVTF